jgi:hypothetical protein
MVMVSRELDLAVPDRGDAGQGPLEVLPEQPANRIELEADAIETSGEKGGGREKGEPSQRRRSGRYGAKKLSPLKEPSLFPLPPLPRHSSLRRIRFTACAQARVVSAM